MKLKVLLAVVFGAMLLGETPAISQEVATGVIQTEGASVEYFSRGSGEAVVLLPGGTLTVGYLDAFANALAAKGYRVIGINFPGSGKSTGPDQGVTLQMLADQIAGVIQALGVGPAHVAGNDFGNRVARMLAASHPDLVKSVILLAAGGKIAPTAAANEALMVMFNPASTDEEILKVMPFFVSNPADSQKVFDMMKPSRAPAAAAIEKMATESTPLSVWWAPAGNTKYLILQGADDQIAPPANGEELKGELGDRATLVNVPGAAHLLPLEQPDVAAEDVDKFIKSQAESQ